MPASFISRKLEKLGNYFSIHVLVMFATVNVNPFTKRYSNKKNLPVAHTSCFFTFYYAASDEAFVFLRFSTQLSHDP